jgi:hypothetical protein
MPETIMPAFDRFVEEGNIIGRLLAGYGELELEMCACVAAVTNDLDAAIRKLNRLGDGTSFSNRYRLIETARGILQIRSEMLLVSCRVL